MSCVYVFVQVQRLCCDLSDDGVFNVGMQSDQRNQANDERIERLMLVGDGHAMQFLEIAHCRIADVFRNAIGHAVDEFDVQSRVAVFDHALAERALIGDEGTGQSHHVIERFRDVADFSIGVPLLQLRDDFVDDVVEHGVRNLVFVLEIVVEERSGHAYATCDIADRDFRKALFPGRLRGLHARFARGVRLRLLLRRRCAVRPWLSLLRSSGVSHLRDTLTLCQFL